MQLIFKYNLEKDMENFLIANKSLGHGGKPSKRQILFEEKYGLEMGDDKLREFIITFTKEKKIDFKERIILFQKLWDEISEEVFLRMEKIFQTKLPVENIDVFLTINDRCSYNHNKYYFFVCALAQWPKITCVHEIFHFFTHLCFESYLKEKGLSRQEFYDLKEALTEIINHEFADLMGGKEFGYTEHKDLRIKIGVLWKQNKDIKKVVEELIKLIKSYERN